MLKKLFLEHPASLGESYLEHQRVAASVGLAMVTSGAACIVHAIVPRMFPQTGSRTLTRLSAQMEARRHGRMRDASANS